MAQGGFIDFKALQSELRLPCFEGDVNALIDTFCLEVRLAGCCVSVLHALQSSPDRHAVPLPCTIAPSRCFKALPSALKPSSQYGRHNPFLSSIR
eukprot:219479-Pelagomonas_calceolata.AAC.1